MNILQGYSYWEVKEPGGVIVAIQNLLKSLSQDHDLSLLINDWEAGRLIRCNNGEQDYFRLRMPPPPEKILNLKGWALFFLRFPIAVLRLRRFCREKDIDMAHLHFLSPWHLCFSAVRFLGGPPYIVTIHGSDSHGFAGQPLISRWVMRIILNHADKVCTVSGWLADAMVLNARLKNKPAVVYNGFSMKADELPDKLNMETAIGRTLPEKFALLAGSMRQLKGQDIALRAWKKVLESQPGFPLLLTGGGPDLEKMKAFAGELGLSEGDIWFLGPQPRDITLGLIKESMMLVAPSRNEGQGIVILEAGFLGTPVICSNIGPFLEMVEEGKTAYLFESDHSDAMADSVLDAYCNPSEARKRAKKLAKRVVNEFSISAMAENYEKIYFFPKSHE